MNEVELKAYAVLTVDCGMSHAEAERVSLALSKAAALRHPMTIKSADVKWQEGKWPHVDLKFEDRNKRVRGFVVPEGMEPGLPVQQWSNPLLAPDRIRPPTQKSPAPDQ